MVGNCAVSFSATPERAVPHDSAWPLEKRRGMMRDIVRLLSEHSALKLQNSRHIAATYGLTVIEVEAEMMRHLSEGVEGK